MGDFKNDVSTSLKPQKANENWTPVKNVPSKTCANCGSKNTVCVYRRGGGSIIGAWFDEEYFCNDCKYYTLYEFEYDS